MSLARRMQSYFVALMRLSKIKIHEQHGCYTRK